MREPLQNGAPHHYDRPNQAWVCGLAADGRACPAGPSASGVCPALAECAPKRDGDRWQCNRSTVRGGRCEGGPTHEGGCPHVHRCEPKRSLRAARGRFVAGCALATAGALMMLLSANWRDEFISPGPLARQHAQLLEQTGAVPNCAACHAAAKDGVAGWSKAMLVSHGDEASQSQLCMSCHEQTIDPQLALAAHNLPAAELQKVSHAMAGGSPGPPRELACANCHHEHHGADFDLTAMDNGSCQACHARRFESLATDHPDFGVWPYERRTRIAFDHSVHQVKHFVDAKQPFDCQTCHVADATQSVQLLAGYEQSCAKCHDEKIATSVQHGVPMFALPILDVEALRAPGFNIGSWPAGATGDFDGHLPAPMKLLLAADPAAAKAMTLLGPDFEFIDVDADDPEHLRATADLAVSIRKLFAEINQAGPEAIRTRLQTVIGRPISESQLDALVAGLSIDTIRPAVADWFPDLPTVGGSWKAPFQTTSTEQPSGTELSFDPAGSWTHNDATFAINYTPTNHADPVLTEWIALLVETPGASERPLESALAKEMAKPTAPGQCTSCHSIEQTIAGHLQINWHALDPRESPRTFTRFSHAPHVTLPQLADCTSCHAVDASANTTASYADRDPHRFVSDFRPISKQACATCHTATAAGDSCQSCHRYHVDTAALPALFRTSSAILPERR